MNQDKYTFELIHKDWAKRRKPKTEVKPIKVLIPDFELKEQHFCNMEVEYEDGTTKRYYSRVIKNHITHQWTVDGMHVAVRVIRNS
jgi:hypothetical protein